MTSQQKARAYTHHMDEAFQLLDLIDAEFQSDPMSVQCFDLRIVHRVKLWVAKERGRRSPMRHSDGNAPEI